MSELHGLAEALKALKEFTPKVNARIGKEALKKGADIVVLSAKQNIASMDAIDTGELYNSVEIWRAKTSYKKGEIAVEVNSSWWGIFVEKGFYHKWTDTHHPARPFFSTALDSNEEQIIGYIGRIIIEEVGKTQAKLDSQALKGA